MKDRLLLLFYIICHVFLYYQHLVSGDRRHYFAYMTQVKMGTKETKRVSIVVRR